MNKNFKGGKFIEAGSYGCVYKNPGLKCAGKPRSTTTISKLMKKKNAIKEKNEYLNIDRIDSSFAYHYPQPTLCNNPELPDTVNDNQFNDCELYEYEVDGWNNLDELAILEQEDGGYSLRDIGTKFNKKMLGLKNKLDTADKYKIREKEYIKIFYSMENLFIGLVEMYENKYFHKDIKPGNIVAKPKGNIYDIRFIDWGMATTEKKWKSMSDSFYFVNSPEMFIYSPIMMKIIKSYNTGNILRKIERFRDEAFFYSYALVVVQGMLINSDESNPYKSMDLTKHIQNIINGDKKKINNVISDIKRKSDVFGLGITLLMMWYWVLGLLFVPHYEGKFHSRSHMHIDILRSINDLIINMCIKKLEDRYTPREALKHFMSIKNLIISKQEFSNFNTKDVRVNLQSRRKISASKQTTRKTSNHRQIQKLNCKGLKKTVEPKCEQQQHCKWIIGKGCKNKSENIPNVARPLKKKCPKGKIINPDTGRCINKNGATARKLRQAGKIR